MSYYVRLWRSPTTRLATAFLLGFLMAWARFVTEDRDVQLRQVRRVEAMYRRRYAGQRFAWLRAEARIYYAGLVLTCRVFPKSFWVVALGSFIVMAGPTMAAALVCGRLSTIRGRQPKGDAAARLPEILDAVDASALVQRIEAERFSGRHGYSPLALWRAYVASFVLNLASTNDLIRRLYADAGLRRLCGFAGGTLPHRTTFNRFIRRLSNHPDEVEQAFAELTARLKHRLPNLGAEVAVDSTVVRTHANPNRRTPSDPEASWTAKNSARAKVGGKDFSYGYKFHMVADATYGIPLGLKVTSAKRNDTRELAPVMERAESLYPWWRPEVAIADKGYDSSENHQWLDDRGVLPIIHIRRPPKSTYYDGLYTETGAPLCMGMVPMEYAGTNTETGHRLYICQEGGCHLKGRKGVAYCNSEVWENPSSNLRLFGKVRRGSQRWKDYYDKRQAIERTFKSMKQSRRLERHCIRGLRQITLHCLMSVLVYQATVLAHVQAGAVEDMRWMVWRVA